MAEGTYGVQGRLDIDQLKDIGSSNSSVLRRPIRPFRPTPKNINTE